MADDAFMSSTLSVWDIPPESARRIGHPAPFPVKLPQRFIELYTYEDDLVLDPFMGSGSTAVASTLSGRPWVGYEISSEYAALTMDRVSGVRKGRAEGE